MADDASSPMMSVTDDNGRQRTTTDDADNGRTSSICERSPTQKALKGNYQAAGGGISKIKK